MCQKLHWKMHMQAYLSWYDHPKIVLLFPSYKRRTRARRICLRGMILRSLNEALYSLRRQKKGKCTPPPPSSQILISTFCGMLFVSCLGGEARLRGRASSFFQGRFPEASVRLVFSSLILLVLMQKEAPGGGQEGNPGCSPAREYQLV